MQANSVCVGLWGAVAEGLEIAGLAPTHAAMAGSPEPTRVRGHLGRGAGSSLVAEAGPALDELRKPRLRCSRRRRLLVPSEPPPGIAVACRRQPRLGRGDVAGDTGR